MFSNTNAYSLSTDLVFETKKWIFKKICATSPFEIIVVWKHVNLAYSYFYEHSVFIHTISNKKVSCNNINEAMKQTPIINLLKNLIKKI